MSMTDDHIRTAHRDACLQERPLNAGQKAVLLQCLTARFDVRFSDGFPWDKPGLFGSLPDPQGWKLIAGYVGERGCLMFAADGRDVWALDNGATLERLLGESPLFEFYVCNIEATYLLCHNHHDQVIGWGEAASWVAGL